MSTLRVRLRSNQDEFVTDSYFYVELDIGPDYNPTVAWREFYGIPTDWTTYEWELTLFEVAKILVDPENLQVYFYTSFTDGEGSLDVSWMELELPSGPPSPAASSGVAEAYEISSSIKTKAGIGIGSGTSLSADAIGFFIDESLVLNIIVDTNLVARPTIRHRANVRNRPLRLD